jgi:hypothetical protein
VDIEGVVKEVPVPCDAPPVAAVYQLIVPAEEVAANPAVPSAHIVAPVDEVILGDDVTEPETATVAEAEVDALSRL